MLFHQDPPPVTDNLAKETKRLGEWLDTCNSSGTLVDLSKLAGPDVHHKDQTAPRLLGPQQPLISCNLVFVTQAFCKHAASFRLPLKASQTEAPLELL